MVLKIVAILSLFYGTASLEQNSTAPLKICLDNSNWRPFIYQQDNQVKGLHIDTIKKALTELNISYKFIPAPWKRCLKGAERGTFDAIATASYNSERAQYLIYPENSHEHMSEWRVGQVQYNIIVHKTDPFRYENELLNIPQPIRVPRDYSIGNDLINMGFSIDDSSLNDIQNLKRLVREGNGSVIALPSIAEWANLQNEFKGKIRLIEKPIKSKSYFLVFAKSGSVNSDLAQKIWQNIKAVREMQKLDIFLPDKE